MHIPAELDVPNDEYGASTVTQMMSEFRAAETRFWAARWYAAASSIDTTWPWEVVCLASKTRQDMS